MLGFLELQKLWKRKEAFRLQASNEWAFLQYLIDPATIGRQVPLQLPVVPSKPTEAADTPAAVAESKAESSGLTPTPSIAAPTSLVAAPTSALVSAPVAVVSPIATLVVPDAAPVAFEEAQSASEAAALHQPAAEQPQAEEPVSPEFVKETTCKCISPLVMKSGKEREGLQKAVIHIR